MEIQSVRIDHGAVPANNGMAYPQRSQPVHSSSGLSAKIIISSTNLRPPVSGGENAPPPHKQPRTALSPPTSRSVGGATVGVVTSGGGGPSPGGYATPASAVYPHPGGPPQAPQPGPPQGRTDPGLRYVTTSPYAPYPRADASIYRSPQIEYLQPRPSDTVRVTQEHVRNMQEHSRSIQEQQHRVPHRSHQYLLNISTNPKTQAPPISNRSVQQQHQQQQQQHQHQHQQQQHQQQQQQQQQQQHQQQQQQHQQQQHPQQQPQSQQPQVQSSQPSDHIRTATGPPEHLRNIPAQAAAATEHLRTVQESHTRNISDHIRSSIIPDHMRNSQEVVRIDGITREQLAQSQMRPRISLLPPSAEYMTAQMGPRGGRDMYRPQDVGIGPSGPNMVPVGHAGHMQMELNSGQPFKKIRLGEQTQKPDMQPLRIDTRDQPAYNPQVEAISPTPNDHGQEDLAFRTTKDDLLQQISRVDREIAKVESSIHKLKKKQQELEEAASKPAIKQEVEEVLQPKHQSQAQKIYAENRRKAQSAHGSLDSLGPKVDWPLYNQPSDTSVYHENKRKHLSFKKRLLEYFKKRNAEKEQRESYLTQTYSKLMQEWLRKVEKIESSLKRKTKEAKNRDFFEKVFPELRKQREDKERFNRVGARIKSEADLEEIMDGLQEQELEDKKMRSYAVIPPILLDARQRKLCYSNNNGHILDMEAEYKERLLINVWTNSEREIFKEKYLQHPKNFGLIASCLEKKSVQDCVQYYYLSKKTENYKQLLRKSRQRTRSSRNNPQKVNNAANSSIVDILTTGVTTRLQREQQQKTVAGTSTNNVTQSQNSSSGSESASTTSAIVTTTNAPMTSGTTTVMSVTATTSSSTVTGQQSTMVDTTTTQSEITVDNKQNQQTKPTSSSPLSAVQTTSTVVSTSTSTNVTLTTAVTTPVVSNITQSQSAPQTSPTNSNSASVSLSESAGQQSVQQQQPSDNQDGTTEKMVVSDQSSSGSVNPSVEKKKKERRKDKEQLTLESSDEEVTDTQEKNIGPQTCVICKAEVEKSRPLPQENAAQYGIRPEQITASARICNMCHCKCVRTRYTHCPLPTCGHYARGRVKRLRTMPTRWATEVPADVWNAAVHEFQIPHGLTKCCSACFNRISRRLAPHLPPSSSLAGSPGAAWSEEEHTRLRTLLSEHGAHWKLIGERLGRPVHQVKNFYLDQRKRLGLDSIVAQYNQRHMDDEHKPVLTDEEESGSTTSSCEEFTDINPRDRLSSDTTSANSPPENVGLSQPELRPTKPDYDSSATETADEGQASEEQRQNYSGQATITVVNGPNQGNRTTENSSPMTVKDLMLNVIELQLMKTPGTNPPPVSGVSVSGITPTISSILKTDGQDIKFVREFKARPPDNSLATLSVVNSHGGHGPPSSQQQVPPPPQPTHVPPHVGQIAATITPLPPQQTMSGIQQGGPPQQTQPQELPREGLVVVQVQQALREREPEPVTLDLSIKRPRDPNPPPSAQKLQHSIYRPPPEQYYNKSPSVYLSIPPRQKAPTPVQSPKPANPKSGSITHGTPVINQQANIQRFDGMMPQATQSPKMGSITQGTPIHHPGHMQDKRTYEYYTKRQSPVTNYTRQPSYTMEQQLSSRQIIMNDYITSQQMHGPPRRNDKSQESPRGVVTSGPLYYEGQYVPRTPPPQRQGVIQRHRPSPPPPRRSYAPPPGHEAFSSLVDVAVQQPQLPVPNAHKETHEGLGKTIADHTHRYGQQLAIHQQRQRLAELGRHQIYRDQIRSQNVPPPQAQPQAHAPPQQSTRPQHGEPSTMTAASLIDAIITHQINLPSAETNASPRENAPPSRPGDRLFQGFHPPMSVENNGSRSPSVIDVDLESDGPPPQKLTVKEFADSVISHDFGAGRYYQHKPPTQADERQIIRVAQQQKYLHASPPRPYNQPPSHLSAFDYVKNRIVEVMRTEDDKRDEQKEPEKSDSPGEMVIDESKHDSATPPNFVGQPFAYPYNAMNVGQHSVVNTNQKVEAAQNDSGRQAEPKPLMSAQYEPLSDED